MIGTLSRASGNIRPKARWKLSLQNDHVLYGKTKADVIYQGVELYELDTVYENMSTRTPQSYLNASKKYGYRTYWGSR